VCFLLNHTYCASINCVPLQHAAGSRVNISLLLCFYFWEQVYYKVDDSDFPSDFHEAICNMVGIAENDGHAITNKAVTIDAQKLSTSLNSILHPLLILSSMLLSLLRSLFPNEPYLLPSRHAIMMLMGSPRSTLHVHRYSTCIPIQYRSYCVHKLMLCYYQRCNYMNEGMDRLV